MTTEQAGIAAWKASIRFNMVNDPARRTFDDQIQLHGFDFLTSYLENILAGPKEDPIIQLVKTPGRRRIAKKAKTAVSKLKKSVTLSLEEDDEFISKENIPPVNSFHKALLQASEKGASAAKYTPPDQVLAPRPIVEEPQSVHVPDIPAIREDFADASVAFLRDVESHELLPSRSQQVDLSIIAEDEEPVDRSRASINLPEPEDMVLYSSYANPTPEDVLQSQLTSETHAETLKKSTSTSGDTFHSIEYENTEAFQEQLQSPRQPSPPCTSPQAEPAPIETRTSENSPQVPKRPLGKPALSLPQIPHSNPALSQPNNLTAPLPSAAEIANARTPSPSPADTVLPKASLPLPPPQPAPTRKPSIQNIFPFTEQALFRKSTFQPSTGVQPLSVATPGAALGGKRTSWLKKVREANALEETGKKLALTGLKRKSGEMLGGPKKDGDERLRKALKLDDESIEMKLNGKSKDKEAIQRAISPRPPPSNTVTAVEVRDEDDEFELVRDEDMQNLKKTINGLRGKSLGKSIGGKAAAAALAEARKAAEARIAERERAAEEQTTAMGPPTSKVENVQMVDVVVDTIESDKVVLKDSESRLSISDLTPSSSAESVQKKLLGPFPATQDTHIADKSHSTTPPNSPPIDRHNSHGFATGPVFNKPPPTFNPQPVTVPPAAREFTYNLPKSTVFSLPPMTLGLGTRLVSPSSKKVVSAQSTMESVVPESIFDTNDTVPPWVPRSQDSEFTAPQAQSQPLDGLDEDDSWPLDEKISGDGWIFGGGAKEDSMTWSSFPTESQRADTGSGQLGAPSTGKSARPLPGTFETDVEPEPLNDEMLSESDLDELVQGGQSTVQLVGTKTHLRSQSQLSVASSVSSQAPTGFIGQASKFVSNMLGSAKKGKTELKSLQLAAAAAKKQQEEKDKKSVRLKEMENRRQQTMQKKAEEEKARALEQEKKLKEESDRRKREREENTEKRALKLPAKKEEDTTKKRKLIVEIEKKQEVKKQPSRIAKANTLNASAMAKTKSTLGSSIAQTTQAGAVTVKGSELKTNKTVNPTGSSTAFAASTKAKAKVVVQMPEPDDDKQPSQNIQAQMAARVKAQLQAAKIQEPEVPSESIELPDIDSEYSDSEDEDRPRTFDPPGWAQSPELRQALQQQSTLNPNDIFGAVPPLRMEELFRTRTSRFRARTSSANWAGTDGLTLEEERDYARRMGYQ